MKIGVGITTYQRFDRFKECFEHLLKCNRDIEEIIVIDDCSVKDRDKYDAYFELPHPNVKFFVNEKNYGVGVSKNKILKYFYERDYDYIFTLEDDINVVSPDFAKKYIEAVDKTGFHYWNFAVHGTMNTYYGIRKKDNYSYKVYPNIVGALSLHTRHLIETVGYYDEDYFNAMEHVDYYYKASILGLCSSFWSFNDIIDNECFVVEQVNSINDSAIRPRADWADNVEKGYKLFKKKNGVSLFDIPRP